MYLLFQPEKNGLRYEAFTLELEPVYSGYCLVEDWSQRVLNQQFQSQILSKLRGHGKVFNRIGIVLPFAPQEYRLPVPADHKLLKTLATTKLRQAVLEPAFLTLRAAQAAWPHLAHYFLFDTCLSGDITRSMALAPVGYEANKQFLLHPVLLHSYGHKANMESMGPTKTFISLCVERQVSICLFAKEKLVDAIVGYSPLSPVMGLAEAGAVDAGFFLEMSENLKHRNVSEFFIYQTGLNAMTHSDDSLDYLLQLTGLIPRKDQPDYNAYPIETVEWIELSLRSFIRSIRHSIGALATSDEEANAIVVSSSIIPPESGFWNLLVEGALSHLKLHHAKTTPLQSACLDLSEARDD